MQATKAELPATKSSLVTRGFSRSADGGRACSKANQFGVSVGDEESSSACHSHFSDG
jgi:hypothetical protein